MENKKFCVALLIADDGCSSAICKNECTVEELEVLKMQSDNGYISLIGWVPYEFYHGGDISEKDADFVYYD